MSIHSNDHDHTDRVLFANRRGRTFFQFYSDFAGRMTSGSCGPLLRLDVKKGRATIIVFRVISVGGTASSKSNDRTKENKMAFILIFPGAVVVSILPMRW